MIKKKQPILLSLASRHSYILEKLQKDGKLNVVSLCNELNVSTVTIRKDLQLLEDKNLLYRTHGGATLSNPYTIDIHVNEKEKINTALKNEIGARAAALVTPNDSIIIASGTTVLALAKHIKPQNLLTVITSAINVAGELNRYNEVEVFFLGGVLRKNSFSATGIYAENMLADFSCTKLFLGVDGIDIEFGLSTTNSHEAHLNKKMMESSQKTIVLADSSKFGRRGFSKICNIEDVNQIITDPGISPGMADKLMSMGIEITITGE